MNVARATPDDLRPEWAELANETGNVFATPEFHECWWKHFARGRRAATYAVRDDTGRLTGVIPLYEWRRLPIAVARFPGHGAGDELGPVAREGDLTAVAGALRSVAPRLVVCEHLRPEWTRAVGGRVLAQEESPVLRLMGFDGWDDYLASRSSNFRQTVRSRERRLARAHDVRFRLADDDSLERDLDTLFRLHRARWRRPSTFGARETFHRDFARVALAAGWARLVVLELDGAAAAAWYGYRFGGADSYYQSGRDPERERESVGLVLLAHTVRAAIEAGRAEYRFLRGGEPYKFRFTDDRSVVQTSALARGPAARAAVEAALAFRISRAAARRLRRSRSTTPPPGASRPDA